jgi:thioredoxin 1
MITENEFKELVNDTIVVQFSAAWCGPCQILTKTIEQNEDKFNIPIYKMDIDHAQQLAQALGIRSVPTIIRFENKQETKRLVGNQTFEQLLELTL